MKKMLSLYLTEFEWRFNHRNIKDSLSKIKKYIQKSSPMSKRNIIADYQKWYLANINN